MAPRLKRITPRRLMTATINTGNTTNTIHLQGSRDMPQRFPVQAAPELAAASESLVSILKQALNALKQKTRNEREMFSSLAEAEGVTACPVCMRTLLSAWCQKTHLLINAPLPSVKYASRKKSVQLRWLHCRDACNERWLMTMEAARRALPAPQDPHWLSPSKHFPGCGKTGDRSKVSAYQVEDVLARVSAHGVVPQLFDVETEQPGHKGAPAGICGASVNCSSR